MTELHQEIAVRMPWLSATGGSYWQVSGAFTERHTFENCLARVFTPEVTGDWEQKSTPLFEVLLTGESKPVIANRITKARQIFMVWADDPKTAVHCSEQYDLDGMIEND